MSNTPRCRKFACILAAFAILGLATACEGGDEEALPQKQQQTIGFQIFANDTRSVIDGNDESTDNTIAKDAYAHGTGFGVMGYKNETSDWEKTFDNQLVTPVTPLTDPAVWSYTPPQFWEHCPYRFYAYYPHSATATIDDTNCTKDAKSLAVTYTVPNTWTTTYMDEQMDFMMSAPKEVATEDNGPTVVFNFRHALCRVGFKIEKEGDTDMEVVDVQLYAINSTGKACSSATEITWDGRTAAKNYSYASGLGSDKSIPKRDIPYMMVMPQNLGNTMYAKLTVKSEEGSTWTMSGRLNAGGVTSWLPGKTYLYTLTVKSDPALMDVLVTISNWTDVKINVTM